MRKDGGGFHVEHDSLEGKAMVIPACNMTATPLASSGKPSTGKEPFHGGWQVYAKQQPTGDVASFVGSWNVPDAPKKYTGQTVFLFTGMQNIDWVPPDDGPKSKFDIIQPVLQYGPSAAGGGKYWSISSWYVPLHDGWFAESVYSDPMEVQEGDSIFGNMTRTGDQAFYISTESAKLKNATAMTINKPLLKTQPWMYVTLESYADYDDMSCDMWPSTTTSFTDLRFTGKDGGEIKQAWQEINKAPVCGDSVAANSQGRKVMLNFKQANTSIVV